MAIFLLKQIISSIRKPDQASLITISPLLIYKDQRQTAVTKKNVRMWKYISIMYWCFYFFYFFTLLRFQGKSLILVILLLNIVILCLCAVGGVRALQTSNMFVTVMSLLCFAGVYLFEWERNCIWVCLMGLGLNIIHTLKVKHCIFFYYLH